MSNEINFYVFIRDNIKIKCLYKKENILMYNISEFLKDEEIKNILFSKIKKENIMEISGTQHDGIYLLESNFLYIISWIFFLEYTTFKKIIFKIKLSLFIEKIKKTRTYLNN